MKIKNSVVAQHGYTNRQVKITIGKFSELMLAFIDQNVLVDITILFVIFCDFRVKSRSNTKHASVFF